MNVSMLLTRADGARHRRSRCWPSRDHPPLLAAPSWPGSPARCRAWGTGPAGGFAALAVRSPDRVGLVDELGVADLPRDPRAANALAHALAELGVKRGRRGRRHVPQPPRLRRRHRRGGQAGRRHPLPQHRVRRPAAGRRARARAPPWSSTTRSSPSCWPRPTSSSGCWPGPTATSPARHARVAHRVGTPTTDLDPPERHARIVILTSGTTGTPKGAPRKRGRHRRRRLAALADAAAARLAPHIAAPLFHTWGFAHLALAMLLGSTVVLRRRFDPEECCAPPRTSSASRWS